MKEKLAKGVFWLGLSRITVNLLALCSTLVLARLLTPQDFGLVALATTLLTIITSMTEMSLAAALVHHQAPTEQHFQTAWTMNFLRAILIATIFLALTPVAIHFYHEPRLNNIMPVIAVSILISGLTNPKTTYMTKNLVFWQEFAVASSQKLAGFIVSVAIAYFYQSYWALVASPIAFQLSGVIVSYLIVPFRPKFNLSHFKDLASFSIWLTFAQMVNVLNWKLDHLLVGRYLGPSVMGHYTVGDNLANLATTEVTSPIQATLFPSFTQLVHDPERIQRAYQTAQATLFAVSFPIGVGFALISPTFVLLAMGEKWMPAVTIIQVIAVTVASLQFSSVARPLSMAKGKTKLIFYRDMLGFSVRVPLIVAGLYFGGLSGILLGRALATIVTIFINMLIVKSLIAISLGSQFINNSRTLISCMAMAAGVLFLENKLGTGGTTSQLFFKLIAFVISGGLIYLCTHFALWFLVKKPNGPEKEIMALFNKLLRKIRPSA